MEKTCDSCHITYEGGNVYDWGIAKYCEDCWLSTPNVEKEESASDDSYV